MSIIQSVCTSFKKELMLGHHDFTALTGSTFRVALYTNTAALAAGTSQYTTAAEVSSAGTGYTTGGEALDVTTPATSGTTAFIDFADKTWSSSAITARGAMVYNTRTSPVDRPAVVIFDFGSDKVSSSGDFTILFPAPDATNAIIRII